MSVTTPQMPFRRERAAPIFDPTRPRSLLRYFEDLEEHFARCCIDDLDARKQWTLRYAPIEAADLWEYLPGWISATDWAAVKRNVAARYPACDNEHRYTFADFTSLVDSQASQEISSVEQWSTFLNQFLVMSQHLISRHRLDPLEQQRYLLRSLSPHLRHEVESHLYQVDPRRDQEQLPSVEEVDVAVQHCFRLSLHSTPIPSKTIPLAEPSNSPKTVEQLSALVAELVEKELAKLEYLIPASLTRKPAASRDDRVFASISISKSPIEPVKVPLAPRRTLALSRTRYMPPQERNFSLPPPKVTKPARTKPESVSAATPNHVYDQLLDVPIAIPLRELILQHSSSEKAVLASKDLKSSKPHEQATMTKKIERELPSQECSSPPTIAIFPLSQVLEAPLSCVEEDRVPKSKPQVPVIESPDLVQSSIASKLRPEPAKIKIEVTPVSPSSSQNQVPHISSALVPLVSNIDRTPVPFATRTNSIISLRSLQFVYSIISTFLTLVLPLVLLPYTCFTKSPSHRKHRARYRSLLPQVAKFRPQVLEC
jgi:hypothetical protein